MFDKMKQLMEMKKQAEQIKKELDAHILEINEVRGIKIVINGSQEFQSIEIESGLLNPDNKKRFENEMLHSVNTAVKKAQHAAASKMKNMTGLNLPGF